LARTASDLPRKGQTKNDPGRLPSYREIVPSFHLRNHPVCASFCEEFTRKLAHPFAIASITVRVSFNGQFRIFGTAILFRLGHAASQAARLATRALARMRDQRCVRPMSASQHSVNEYPYSSAPGSSSGLAACVHLIGCAYQNRGIERFTTPKSLRQSPRHREEYSSDRGILNRAIHSDTLCRFPHFRRCRRFLEEATRGERSQDRFYETGREA